MCFWHLVELAYGEFMISLCNVFDMVNVMQLISYCYLFLFQLHLSLTPLKTGELHIVGLSYNLATNPANHQNANLPTIQPNSIASLCVRGKQPLEVQGPRLNATKAEKTSKTYGPDRRLDLVVAPQMPLLEVSKTNKNLKRNQQTFYYM